MTRVNTGQVANSSLSLTYFTYHYIILPLVLYSCEICSFPLREDRRLGVYENRRLRKIVGPNGDEVTREWRRLHSEELYDLYCSLNT
jgi:hypothetical protein